MLVTFFFAGVLLFLNTPVLKAGLIEPTRTLNEPTEEMGKLSVYSEPPGLAVTLDGRDIGKTPIIEEKIGAGSYKLQIKNSETEIFITPAQSAEISWFKGTFIEIPPKKQHRPPPTPPETVSEKRAQESTQPEQTPKKQELDPFYWPLNPRGPIY